MPGLDNDHGYDVMNCIIVMTSCEYQALNNVTNIFITSIFILKEKGLSTARPPVRHLVRSRASNNTGLPYGSVFLIRSGPKIKLPFLI